ncbi:hypothetical protein YDYSG_27440 [Paenibacillus tyrfis]|uniref:tRNA-guanine transglycosylase DpdA n=1 Tax=Paenibacillus tyrfis TaxID=1501230 RepID=UPI002493BA85|nr:tRNA-guanine transglycosylase DpdA [Paenibacillus tyrfis]GLI06714.1 hypothetical protein YDYSG_27440 [Paenibacillus tyrfis]
MRKILVISSCTGEKKVTTDLQLLEDDFKSKESLENKEEALEALSLPAKDMYTGLQHLRLMEGINNLRNKYGHDILDLYIVSAGYGLIHEDKVIAPYEVTFNTMNGQKIIEWSKFLNVHRDLENIIENYDVVFFLLGDGYLRALELPMKINDLQRKLIFLASKTSKRYIPNNLPYYFVEVGQQHAKSFSYGLVGLKGYLFKLLAQEWVNEGPDYINEIIEDPSIFIPKLSKFQKEDAQISLFPEIEQTNKKPKNTKIQKKEVQFVVSKENYAKNYGLPMVYFIPEWDDRVDPNYDFISDTSVEKRDPYLHDSYAHEIYGFSNYDGILISKVKVEENKSKKTKIGEMGVHSFLRYPTDRPIMGDCGAFGYINEIDPPYSTDEILNYYESLGFNLGVSIDHLIVGDYAKDPIERQRRYKITETNAADFIKKHKEGNYTFLPSGVAQGWDPQSYKNSVSNLIDMGYRHISIGGLARSQTTQIIDMLRELAPIIPDYLQLHLFGVARLDAVETFRKLGATAFDSASHLRRAWLGSGSNYFSLEGTNYAAIRVPPVDGHGVRVKRMIEEGRGTADQFRKLEANALSMLRRYDKGEETLETTLEAVLAYDELIGDGREIHTNMYRKVLEDQPWKKCDCKICKEVGIEVIIFRGNNRNRRRGFHNTYVFYKKFKEVTL